MQAFLQVIFGLICIYNSLQSEEIPLSKSKPDVDEHVTQSNLTAGPNAFVRDMVNVITGDYVEHEIDLILDKPSPIVFERSYSSSFHDKGTLNYGWNLNHFTTLYVSTYVKKPKIGTVLNRIPKLRAYLNEGQGAITSFRGHFPTENKKIRKKCIEKGMTNCGKGEIGGRTNPKNITLTVRSHNPNLYFVKEGSGIIHNFEIYCYEHKVFNLAKTFFPNGNHLEYNYNKLNQVSSCQLKSALKHVLGEFSINYYPKNFGEKKIRIQVKNAGNIQFTFNEFNNKWCLKHVERPFLPDVHYGYGFDYYGHIPRIITKSFPDKRTTYISYWDKGDVDNEEIRHSDPRFGRVKEIREPVGSDERLITTYSFHYQLNSDKRSGITNVYDANHNLTKYVYNKEQRLTSIQYCGKRSHFNRKENFYWGTEEQTANLIAHSIADTDGNVLMVRTLSYDLKGNPLEDCLCGNLSGNNVRYPYLENDLNVILNGCESFAKICTFSNDEFNLKLSEAEGQQKVTYRYVDKSDQLAAKFIYEGERIRQRYFYTYDLRGMLTGEIIDDGTSNREDDLTGVSQRTIRAVSGRNVVPVCLPEIEYEQYVDENNEIKTNKRIVNLHTNEGKLYEQHHYDHDNNLRYRLHWEYDQKGNVKREVNAAGEEILRRFDSNQNIVYEYGPSKDYYTEFAYDYMNRLTKVTKVDCKTKEQFTTEHKYDLRNNRIATIDIYGNETNFEYDEYNRLVKTVLPAAPDTQGALFRAQKQVEYDCLGYPLKLIDGNGYITEQRNTLRGQPYLINFPDGSREKLTYNLDGTLREKIEKNGLIIRYTYDYQKRPLKTELFNHEDELISVSSIEYNAFHPIKEIDNEGNVTRYEYDRIGRLSGIFTKESAEYYSYDNLGRKNRIKTFYGYQPDEYTLQSLEYDLRDRIVEDCLQDSLGNVLRKQTYVYDKDDNQTQINVYTDFNVCSSTNISYNIHKQPIKSIDPEGNITTFNYRYDYRDSYGINVPYSEAIDPKGNLTITVGNAIGKTAMIQKKNAFGRLIQQREFFYDGEGQLVQTTETVISLDEGGREVITQWKYNELGEVKECIEAVGTPEQKHTVHTFNSYGQKEATIKPDGTLILFIYDFKGRLENVSSSNQTLSYSYFYDKNDNPVKIVDNINQTENIRSYDHLNRIIEEKLGNNLNVKYSYDREGKVHSVTLPDQSHVVYGYNAAADLINVKRISYPGELLYFQSYQYDLAGNLIETQLPFKLGDIKRTYDSCRRPLSITTSCFSEKQIKYDSVGSLLSHVFKDPKGELTCEYTYDDLYQISTESGVAFHNYIHDSLHNRIFHNGVKLEVNALNQLLLNSKGAYLYDLNGNLVEKESQTYSYDVWDRLTNVTEGNARISYQYDDLNRRISKTTFNWDPIANAWITANVLYYLYIDNNEVGEYDSSHKPLNLRILGYGKGAEIGAAITFEINQEIFIPLVDSTGSTRVLLNQAGIPIDTYRYTAFGEEILYCNNPFPVTDWRFCSKRKDIETGFVYFGRRYYDSFSGRWITTDPLGYEPGPNLYAYVHNNPLTKIDLYGLEEEKQEKIEERQQISSEPKVASSLVWKEAARESVGGFVNSFFDPFDTAGRFYSYATMGTKAIHNWDFREIKDKWNSKKSGWVFGRICEAAGLGIQVIPVFRAAQGTMTAIRCGLASRSMGKYTCTHVAKTARLKGPQATTKTMQIGQKTFAIEVELTTKEAFTETVKTTRRKHFVPNLKATGMHTVFSRNGSTNRITHYETFRPQTNPRNPNLWESVIRFDFSGKLNQSHYNKFFDIDIYEPHVHDPIFPGKIRPAFDWEIPVHK